MARYQIILAYDGTDFLGFQRQGQGRTVQSVVETALHQIGWQGSSIIAAGRTDTGVHASGQVVAFDLEWGHTPEELLHALNANLPVDTAVQHVSLAPAEFHPRYDASDRTYVYSLYCQPERNPLRDRYAWRVHPLPQHELLNIAAACFCGLQDYSWLQLPLKVNDNPVREVQVAQWDAEGDGWRFTIRANAFLYHMVRRIVYLCVVVAQGRLAVDELQQHGATGSLLTPGMAPPQGLCLTEVRYLPYDRRKKSIPQTCGSCDE